MDSIFFCGRAAFSPAKTTPQPTMIEENDIEQHVRAMVRGMSADEREACTIKSVQAALQKSGLSVEHSAVHKKAIKEFVVEEIGACRQEDEAPSDAIDAETPVRGRHLAPSIFVLFASMW